MDTNLKFKQCSRIKILCCCLAVFAGLCASGKGLYSLNAPRGILLVDNTKNNPPQKGDLFDVKGVGGLCEYVKWSELEPAEGEYAFDALVSFLKRAQVKNKKIALGILTGIHLPSWYKTKFPEQIFRYVRFQKREDVGTILLTNEAVLPWIRLAKQNEKSGKRYGKNEIFFMTFHKMLQTLSLRLEKEGLIQTLAYVAITGPGTHNGLEIQLPLLNGDDWVRLDWGEETQGLWKGAWANSVENFRTTFPNSPLTLSFADIYGCKITSSAKDPQPIHSASISRNIIEGVMAGEKPSSQHVFPMGLWLADWNRWDGSHDLCNILLEQRKKGFAFGLQSHLMKHRNLATMQTTIDKAIDAQSSWMELWYSDAFQPGFEESIQKILPYFENL